MILICYYFLRLAYGCLQAQSNQNAPPRRRPSNLTIPSPLSPREMPVDPFPESSNSPGHRRTRSMASGSNRSLNAPSSRRDRKSISSGSTVPEITIEPPVRNYFPHLLCASLTYLGLCSLGPLQTTRTVRDLEQQAYLVQITPRTLFPMSNLNLQVPRLYPQCQIHL